MPREAPLILQFYGLQTNCSCIATPTVVKLEQGKTFFCVFVSKEEQRGIRGT